MSVRGATSDDDMMQTDDAYIGDQPFSLIDSNSSFDGTFKAERNLRIEGDVKGAIHCQGTLFVAEGAVVAATIEAENVTVAGELNGEVRCQGRLQIMPSGRLRGEVETRTLVVNEGAIYEGQLVMPSADQSLRSGRSASNAPVPIAAASEGRTSGGGNATTFIRRKGGPETPWDTEDGRGQPPAEAASGDEREASR